MKLEWVAGFASECMAGFVGIRTAIRKLQKERPQIAGLAVPGMPAGSLGMGEDTSARYVVVSVDKSGEVRPFPDIGE